MWSTRLETTFRTVPEEKPVTPLSYPKLPPCQTFEKIYGPVRFFMAPMAGITDMVFRLLIREMGAQVVISELISSEGLIRGGEKTLDLMRYDERERPVGIQLFGSEITSLVEAAKIVEQKGADFVDINFGCPVKKIVCDGSGAAWLREPQKMFLLLSSVKKVLSIPLTIKIRTGWDESTRNAKEVIQASADAGVSWVAIHGRTRAQGYEGKADWEFIRLLAQESPVPIIGNGDILNARQAQQRIDEGYAHGVMIGRGALKNPWVFKELKGETNFERNFLELIERHFDLALEKKDRRRAYLSLKKFMGWYAAGFPNSSQFRHSIFETHEVEELRTLTLNYFHSLDAKNFIVRDEPFLMGGHG